MLLYLLQATAPSTWNEDVIAKATVVIAVSTVIYVIATVLLWLTTKQSVNITRDMFESSHRPYIAAVSVAKTKHDSPPSFSFEVSFKNVGSVPAYDFQCEIHVLVDGIFLPNSALEEEPFAVIYPTIERAHSTHSTGQSEYDSIANAAQLVLIFKCSYKGVAQKKYAGETKYIYNKRRDTFGAVKETATEAR